MQRKIKISITLFAMILLSLLTTNLVLGANSLATPTPLSVTEPTLKTAFPKAIDGLEKKIPITFEEAKTQLVPLRARYLLWTHNGVHIMWGVCGNGRFTGTDNLGKRCWGIYGKGIFAGFYDGEFFWGKYRNGTWKAQDLFAPGSTYGRYILFPLGTTNITDTNLP